MVDENPLVPSSTSGEASVEVEPSEAKRKAARNKKPPAEAGSDAPKPRAARKFTSQAAQPKRGDSLRTLELIDSLVSQGTPLKDAIKQSGVSKQSYYRWKKIGQVGAVAFPSAVIQSDVPQGPASDDFSDLVQLEAENQRLRALLAEKLRKENAVLRERLGLN